MWDDWTLAIKNLMLPIFCKQCGRRLLTEENGFFCPTCWEMSPRIEPPLCRICGRPLRAFLGLRGDRPAICGPCSGEKADRPYRRIVGAAFYADAVEEAVKLFKFHGKRKLAEPLGELMVDAAQRELPCDAYAYVVPIPLHRVRHRARGFNQSRLLAEQVLTVCPGARLDESLRRVRPTRVQSRLATERERKSNVRGAFAVENGDHLIDKTVLLVDDVVTSSGTVAECASVLRNAGASCVDILVAALAVPVPDLALSPASQEAGNA